MFELDEKLVQGIISKMIIHEEIQGASLDEKGEFISFQYSYEMTRLEWVASVYAEKVGQLVENNERLMEAKSSILGLYVAEKAKGSARGTRYPPQVGRQRK